MTEIIKCSCGTVFAACVDGYQDKDWREARQGYLEAGCKVEFVQRKEFELSSCDCPKSKEEVLAKNQLSLFE